MGYTRYRRAIASLQRSLAGSDRRSRTVALKRSPLGPHQPCGGRTVNVMASEPLTMVLFGLVMIALGQIVRARAGRAGAASHKR